MQTLINQINLKNWADCYLGDIAISFEELTIQIQERNDSMTTLYCKKHIGFEYIGQWDESVIESLKIYNERDCLTKSLDNANSISK